ncbi:MAG: hypothetical protein V4735_03860 [Pseudomonadota bacterium]
MTEEEARRMREDFPPSQPPVEPNPNINPLSRRIYLSDLANQLADNPDLARQIGQQDGNFLKSIAGEVVAHMAEHPNFRAEAHTKIAEDVPKYDVVEASFFDQKLTNNIQYTYAQVAEAMAPIVARADEALRDRSEEIIQGFSNSSEDPYIGARQERGLRAEAAQIGAISERLDGAWARARENAAMEFKEEAFSIDAQQKAMPDDDPADQAEVQASVEQKRQALAATKTRLDAVIEGKVSPYDLTGEQSGIVLAEMLPGTPSPLWEPVAPTPLVMAAAPAADNGPQVHAQAPAPTGMDAAMVAALQVDCSWAKGLNAAACSAQETGKLAAPLAPQQASAEPTRDR